MSNGSNETILRYGDCLLIETSYRGSCSYVHN